MHCMYVWICACMRAISSNILIACILLVHTNPLATLEFIYIYLMHDKLVLFNVDIWPI